MRIIWHNGEFKNESAAMISIYDMAMMYSYPFEMTRTFRKQHFKLPQHLVRLYHSMKYLGMEVKYSITDLTKVCNELVERNTDFKQTDEHRLIINAYGGCLGIYKDVMGTVEGTHIMITDIPLRWTVQGMGELFDNGINVVIPNQKTIPSEVLDNRVKSHCRLHFLRANLEVSQIPGTDNWPLLTDQRGFVTEFPGANFFIVKNDRIITPKPINILEGVSRSYILNQLCEEIGIDYSEEDILPYDIINAQEAFCSATPFCILPITKFHSTPIGDGLPGKITMQLLRRWSKNVGVDIIKQIKDFNIEMGTTENITTPYTLGKKK